MTRRISALLLCAAALAACGHDESPRPDAVSTGRASAFAPGGRGQQVDFAAVSYFADHCARCHGPEGKFYGADFGKNLNDADLKARVSKMAAGPGSGPLQPQPLVVESAYQRSIQEKTPFIHVMTMEKTAQGWTLRGEVSPDATVEIHAGGQTFNPTIKDTLWTADVPAADAEIIARRGGAETHLKLAEGMWSHGVK